MIWISDISGFFIIKKINGFVCMLDFIFYFLSPWILLMGKNVHIVHACHVETLGLYFMSTKSCLVRSNFIFFLVSVAIDYISNKILILLEDEN